MDLWAIKTLVLWNNWQLYFTFPFSSLFPAHHPQRGRLEAEWIHRIKMYFAMETSIWKLPPSSERLAFLGSFVCACKYYQSK